MKTKIKTITSFFILIQKARRLAEAEETGIKSEILKAQIDHDNYKKLCLESDYMSLNQSIK